MFEAKNDLAGNHCCWEIISSGAEAQQSTSLSASFLIGNPCDFTTRLYDMAVSLFDQWWRIILYLVIYTSCCALYLISKQSNCFELCPPCIEYWLGCKFKKKLEKSRSHIANSFVLRFKQAIVLLLLLILSDPLHPAFLSNCDKLERMLWFGIVVELWWVSNCVKT